MIAVCVTFRLKPGAMAEFRPRMEQQARDSIRKEPDCHRFDVCFGGDHPDDVFLYELYTDRPAFAVHLASAHFLSFDAAVATLVAEKSVRIFDEVAVGSE